MVVCNFFLQNRCRYGNRCKFEHPGQQQQQQQQFTSGNRFGALSSGGGSGFNSRASSGQSQQSKQEPANYGVTADDIKADLTAGNGRPDWIFSCYGPGRNAPKQLFGGPEREQSFEELRLRHYEAAASGNPSQAVIEAENMYKEAVNQMEIILKNLNEAVRYVVDGGKEHPNRIDICKGTPGPAAGQPSAFGQPSTSAFSAPGFGSQQPPSQPGFGQPAFGQPSQPSQPSAFGQPSALGQSSGFGQPSALGSSSGFGQPSALGSSSGFGQPSALGSSSGFGKPAFGQTSQPSQPSFGQSGFGQSVPGQTIACRRPSLAASPFGQASGTASPFSQISAPSSGSGQPSAFSLATNNFVQPSSTPATSGFGTPSQPANPFGQPSAPFGQAAQPASNSFGAAQQQAGGPLPASQTSASLQPLLKVENSNDLHPIPPLMGETTRNPLSKRLLQWKGQPVQYINDAPCYLHPQDRTTYVRIFFPDGPPSESSRRDAHASPEQYTPEITEQYEYFLKNGAFKDGLVPSVPPKTEWVSFDF